MENAMKIREADVIDVLFHFQVPSLVRYYMNLSIPSVYYVGEVQEQKIAYAVVHKRDVHISEIVYLKVIEEYESQGYEEALLDSILYEVRGEGQQLMVRHMEQRLMKWQHVLEAYSLEMISKSCIVRCDMNEENCKLWNRNMKKYTPMMQWMKEKFKLTCDTLEEVSQEIYDKIAVDGYEYFDKKYNPSPILHGVRGKVDRKCSVILHQDGEPVAISIVLETSKKVATFELLAVAKKFQQSGTIILAWNESFSRMVAEDYETLSYCIYEENSPMIQFAKQFLVGIEQEEKHQLVCFIQGRREQ